MKTLFSLFITLSLSVAAFGQSNTTQSGTTSKSTTSKGTTSNAAANKTAPAAASNSGQNTATATSHTAQPAPPVVSKGFEQKFPNVSKVVWTKMGEKQWRASFADSGSTISARFDENGAWMETNMAMMTTDLPKTIADAIKSGYAGYSVMSAMKVDAASSGITYQVRIKKETTMKGLIFKEDGTLVTK